MKTLLSNYFSAEEVEKCKENDVLEQLLLELSNDYPALTRVLLDERNLYMTYMIRQAMHMMSIHKYRQYVDMRRNGIAGEYSEYKMCPEEHDLPICACSF